MIGVGYLGNFHTEKYTKLPNVELVGVVDANPLRAKEIAAKYHTNAFHSVDDILDRVDAVSIAVPTDQHYEVARKCLEQGIDVLIEKPITHKLWQAEALIDLAKERKCILQVGHLERFNPAIEKMKSSLTHPLFIECHRLHSFVQRGTEVDVVLDLMIHDLDIILDLVQSPVASLDAAGVNVMSDLIDIANVRLKFESGCVANVTASRISMKPMRKIRFFQEDCYVSCDFQTAQVEIYRQVKKQNEKLPEITAETLSLEKKDALEEEIKSFLQAVQTRSRPRVSGEDALRALRLAQSIVDQIHVTVPGRTQPEVRA